MKKTKKKIFSFIMILCMGFFQKNNVKAENINSITKFMPVRVTTKNMSFLMCLSVIVLILVGLFLLELRHLRRK
jgi:hypothetical protein